MLGKLLDGRYLVIQVLGAGGFGQTYLAQDTRRPGNPICVVKHLKPASSDPNFLQVARRLFNSEAETLEHLGQHDQIPRLLAYFEEEQEFYLVQEFVDGHTLTTELLGRRWTEAQVIQMLEEILVIMEFIHSQGVIHRDVKPDNLIRRTSDNKIVLVDFGAVKQVRTQMANTPAVMSATVAVGTPGYMPSEQGRGQPRPNSDIYALGIIGIQALTGLLPLQFQEDAQTGEIIWQHLVPVSPGLAAILTKMVRYHFKDRYQSATEALQALRQPYSPPSPVQYPPYPAYPPTAYPPSHNDIRPTEPSTPPSGQYTLPVAPANPYREPVSQTPSYQPANPYREPVRQTSSYPPAAPSSNKLPLILASALATAVIGGMAIAFYQRSQPDIGGGVTNVENTQEVCTVVIGSLNVRSGPSTNSDRINSVSEGTKVTLTGNQENGWVEINSPVSGWVFRDPKYINCPTASATQTNTPPVKPSPNSTADRGKQILAQATEKYQSGDLKGAIALARLIPRSSSANGNANKAIAQWQRDWSVAEAIYNEAEQAFNQGRWNDVIDYSRDPRFPSIRYWKNRLNQLAAKAQEKLKETPAPTPTETSSPSPTPTETPTESPSPTETPTESPIPIEVPTPEP